MSFHEHSKEIVSDYLGTVAYVDDHIFSKKDTPRAIKLGVLEIRETTAKDSASEIVEKVNESEPKQQLVPNIDPLSFTNAFLEKGIHCALLEVEKDQDSLESIKKILKKSDVVILDWQMHQDLGAKATELLLSVLDSKKLDLRLIIIYTEDNNYATLIGKYIIPRLTETGFENGFIDETGCKYQIGHTKIVSLKKKNGIKNEFAVSDQDLPNRVIEEFSQFTEGLVSNIALKAISIIRRNSHNLLGVFNEKLDSAYLAHRVFLDCPSDSEGHIVDWFSDELKDLLYINNVTKEVDISKIKLLLGSFNKTEYSIYDKNGKENKKIPSDNMSLLLDIGCKAYNSSLDKKNEKHLLPVKWFSHFHKTFEKNAIDVNANEKLAALSSLSLSSFNN